MSRQSALQKNSQPDTSYHVQATVHSSHAFPEVKRMKNIIPFPNAHSGESNGDELPAPDDYLEALELALERRSSLEQFEKTVDAFLASVSNDCWFRTELPSVFRLPTRRHYAANSFSC
jgi:hypothetical protein